MGQIQTDSCADSNSRIGRKNSGFDYPSGQDSLPRTSESHSAGRTIFRELERERSRIARDLHAGAGQPLAGMKLNLEILDACASMLPDAARDALCRLQILTGQALEQIRAVSHSLHPPDWQGLTTSEALHYLIGSSGLRERLKVEMDIRQFPLEPSHTVKIAIYRCVQECISNVTRHSGATHFTLFLAANGCMADLKLEDNGRGFPSEGAGYTGIGLLAIREHAEALGGTCDISSRPTGVRIRVQLPLGAD